MGSLVRRGKKWTATARLPDTFQGPCRSRSISETFAKKGDAQTWLSSTESAMKLGTWKDSRLDPKPGTGKSYLDRPFRDALDDYRTKVTPTKKGADAEAAMLGMLARESFAEKTPRQLTVAEYADFRDARKQDGKANQTIRNNLNTISAVYQWMIYQRGVPVENPIARLRLGKGMPKASSGRERRLRAGEEEALLAAMPDTHRGRQWRVLFRMLVDTGMRLTEALSVQCGWLRRDYGFIVVPDSKNNTVRYVAVSDEAFAALVELADEEPDEATVFRMNRFDADNEWRKYVKDAAVTDLHIHDLRHEALSRMAGRGVGLEILMRQSGHKTVAVLMRYLNPTPEEQRRKLFGERLENAKEGGPESERKQGQGAAMSPGEAVAV